ncbi:MAG: ATP/GTP-binding protein [Anaerolineales bacterium]
MRQVKLLITGPFGAGKSRMIRAISEIRVVSTERRLTRPGPDGKQETTVAMDYGRVTIGDRVVHLTGTPGQPRFDFMWDILSRESDAFLLVVDSTAPAAWKEAKELLGRFQDLGRPYVIAANKQDLSDARTLRQIERALTPGESGRVIPCIGTRPSSVRQVLLRVLEELP